MHYAKTAQKIREQILRFSGELSFGLPKPASRFIAEMIYGIKTRQSVRLTEIGRALEEQIPLKKIEYRLCRQLKRKGLWGRLIERLCRMAASRIQELTLLILDLTGLRTKLLVSAGHVLRAAHRIFGIPEFRFYALADGIKEHLFGQKRSIQAYFSAHPPESCQRLLFFPKKFGGTPRQSRIDFFQLNGLYLFLMMLGIISFYRQ